MGFYGKIYNEIKEAFTKIKLVSNDNKEVEVTANEPDSSIIIKAGNGISLNSNEKGEILIDSTILNPLKFKGSLNEDQFETLNKNGPIIEGDMYKISDGGWRLYNNNLVKINDTIIFHDKEWILIPSGDDIEDTWRKIKVNDQELLGGGTTTGDLEFKDGKENGTFLVNNKKITIPKGTNITEISKNSFAEGANTKAGTKAFKITALSGTTGKTGTYTLKIENEEDMAMFNKIKPNEMRYSAVTSIAAYNQGKITSISGNVVTVDNFPGDSAHPNGYPLNNAVDDPENYNMYNLFIIVDRPDLGTLDAGFNAHAEGNGTYAAQVEAHAEGRNTKALGKYAHTEGIDTMAGHASHAEGSGSEALGVAAHAEGQLTVAKADVTHAEGFKTKAMAPYSHAEGFETQTSGQNSHAEGESTEASGQNSHVEGRKTKASGKDSHAEGGETIATAYAAHAEGNTTQANGNASHSEGSNTIANGTASHAEGINCIADGNYSHAEGLGAHAKKEAQHVEGKYNIIDNDGIYAHILGNGDFNGGNPIRSNAHTVDWDGNAWYAGDVFVGADRISFLNLNKKLEKILGSKELYPAAFTIWNGSGPIGSPTVGEPLKPNIIEPEATYRVAVTPGKSYRFTPTPQGDSVCYFAVGDAEGNCLFYTKESLSGYTVKESYDGKIPTHIYYGVKNIHEVNTDTLSFCEVGILEQLAQRVAAIEAAIAVE